MVNAFRKRGIKVLWLQWGLTEHDLIHMPPSYLYNFGEAMTKPTMGEEMGALAMSDGTTIGMGRMLMRGTWNSEAWGDLLDVQKAGLEAGTDFYFDKSVLTCISALSWKVGAKFPAQIAPAGFGERRRPWECFWNSSRSRPCSLAVSAQVRSPRG